MQYTLFIKEKEEQRYHDEKVGHVQYIRDDTKGLKHKLHFYQIFLHSLPLCPLLLPFAGLDSVIKITAPWRTASVWSKNNIYHYTIKGVHVSFVYNFVWRRPLCAMFSPVQDCLLRHTETGEMQCLSSSNAQHLFSKGLLLRCALYVWFWS